ncbi:MAG: cytidylate kinase-like family protein [Acidimicrobiales bacterium]
MARLVTFSAAYGAGGSIVAPAVASALGFPFLDRAVPAARSADVREDPEAATEEERTEGFLTRLLSSFVAGPDGTAGVGAVVPGGRDEEVRLRAQARVEAFASADGVILGWGSSILAKHAFHVHLEGPEEARVRQAMSIGGIDQETARRRRADTDSVRETYLRRLYGRDWRDLSLYHLILDSTALPLGLCTDVVVAAARGFWDQVR